MKPFDTKRCPKCGEFKDITHYRRNQNAKTIQVYCRECRAHKTRACKTCNEIKDVSEFKAINSPTCNACLEYKKANGKVCCICNKFRSANDYHKSSSLPDGMQRHCKDCAKSMSKVWDAGRNKELRNIKQNNRAKNKRLLAAKGSPNHTVGSPEWRRDRRIIDLVAVQNSRARRNNRIGFISTKDWRYVLGLANFRCLCCGIDFDWVAPKGNATPSVDHILPVSLGGANMIENVQPLCLRCNLRKGDGNIDFRTREFIEAVEQNCALNRMVSTRNKDPK